MFSFKKKKYIIALLVLKIRTYVRNDQLEYLFRSSHRILVNLSRVCCLSKKQVTLLPVNFHCRDRAQLGEPCFVARYRVRVMILRILYPNQHRIQYFVSLNYKKEPTYSSVTTLVLGLSASARKAFAKLYNFSAHS